MSLQEMEDLKQHYLDEMLSLSNDLGIKDYRNEKIDIHFRRECEDMIDELKGKFNRMSIEINKKIELQRPESIPLRDIISKLPLSIEITSVLPTLEPEDSLIMGDEELSTILEKESNEFINSSVKDLVPIPSESEDTSGSDSESDLPSCADFSPINVSVEKSVTFSNLIFNSNDDLTSKNIESKDSYVSNLDEPAFLVTPLSAFNEDEFFDQSDDVDEIELLLHRDPSTPKISIASILEGFTDEPPLKENDDLFDLKSKENKWKKILYDAPIDDLMTKDKVFDPRILEKKFSPTYVRLPFEDRHYLSLTYVFRIFIPYFTYPVESPFLLSSGSTRILDIGKDKAKTDKIEHGKERKKTKPKAYTSLNRPTRYEVSAKHQLAVKGLSECKASKSNIRRNQVKDIVKEVEDYLKTYSSAGMDNSWYFSFRRHLDELRVTWAHLEKKHTRLQTNTNTLEDLCSQSLETASQAIHDASIFSSCYLFRNPFSLTTLGDENPIRTLGDYSKPSHEGYRNTIELPEENNVRISIRSMDLFQGLTPKVPHHGIDRWLQIQIFYDHVSFHFKCEIDRAAGEKICIKNIDESWEIIENLTLYNHEGPSPQPQALDTTFEARVWDYMAAHTERMERFENTIFKQRKEMNGRMTEMFGLLKELMTSRTPKKVLIREETKFPVTKNVNSTSLTKDEERGSNRTKVTPDNAEKLTKTETGMPVIEVEKINEVENGAKNKSIKTSKSEEAAKAPGSQPVAYYLKYKINEKLIKGLVNNTRFNNSRLRTQAKKKKGKAYKVLPGGPAYDAILKKMIIKKEDIEGNFKIPCSIGNLKYVNALVDQGSDVNVMPYSTYTNLTNKKPIKIDIRLSLASHSYIYPLGIAEGVLVDIAKHVYPVDFMILDIMENKNRPFIL
ncbi:MAK10-like protein [Tanacetum coccineum]